MDQIIRKHTFIQDETGYEMVVYTRAKQSAFAALYAALRQSGAALQANWRLMPAQSRTFVPRASAEG